MANERWSGADLAMLSRRALGGTPLLMSRFVDGYTASGGVLPTDWWAISRAVDLFALVQFLSRPPEHRHFRKSVRLLRSRLADPGR